MFYVKLDSSRPEAVMRSKYPRLASIYLNIEQQKASNQ